MEVINSAEYGSIAYHPSLLPRHRGASAISWTLIEGDKIGGFTIFWVDDGLDTGPILLQRQCEVLSSDTLDSLYKRFLYPEGIIAMTEAVQMISKGTAPKQIQPTEGATYDPAMFREENQILNFDNKTALEIFNFIRGLDSNPGALVYVLEDETEIPIRLFGAELRSGSIPEGKPIIFKSLQKEALVHKNGILIFGSDGNSVNIQRIKRNNKFMNACKYYDQNLNGVGPKIELTEEEHKVKDAIVEIWENILKIDVDDSTDFFASGAGSMDVVRLVEEIKEVINFDGLENEVVFLASILDEFIQSIIEIKRSGDPNKIINVIYEGIELKANNREIKVPTQMFINNEFLNAENDAKLDIINPTTEEVICKVASASVNDVNKAVEAAHDAFYGPWSQLTARQRGRLMYKLADLMEQHKEELATIEGMH